MEELEQEDIANNMLVTKYEAATKNYSFDFDAYEYDSEENTNNFEDAESPEDVEEILSELNEAYEGLGQFSAYSSPYDGGSQFLFIPSHEDLKETILRVTYGDENARKKWHLFSNYIEQSSQYIFSNYGFNYSIAVKSPYEEGHLILNYEDGKLLRDFLSEE